MWAKLDCMRASHPSSPVCEPLQAVGEETLFSKARTAQIGIFFPPQNVFCFIAEVEVDQQNQFTNSGNGRIWAQIRFHSTHGVSTYRIFCRT